MMIDVKAFDSIRDEFVKFGRAHQFTFNAFDQGWINAFGRDELLTNRWNWKIYWANSTGIKIVRFEKRRFGKHRKCSEFFWCKGAGENSGIARIFFAMSKNK